MLEPAKNFLNTQATIMEKNLTVTLRTDATGRQRGDIMVAPQPQMNHFFNFCVNFLNIQISAPSLIEFTLILFHCFSTEFWICPWLSPDQLGWLRGSKQANWPLNQDYNLQQLLGYTTINTVSEMNRSKRTFTPNTFVSSGIHKLIRNLQFSYKQCSRFI